MRLEHGIKRRDRSPSRLDTFLKGIEEERDFYKKELERLQHIIQRRSCSTNYFAREKSSIFKTLEKVISFIRVMDKARECLHEQDFLMYYYIKCNFIHTCF